MKGRVHARERKDSDEEEHGTPAGEGYKNPESRDLYRDRASLSADVLQCSSRFARTRVIDYPRNKVSGLVLRIDRSGGVRS
jgi:hypothetical protein